jgi:membrane-bound lytic murein transglycosylase B
LRYGHRLCLSLIAAGSFLAAASGASALDTRSPEVAGFIDQLVARDAYDPRTLRRILGAARLEPAIVAAMERPAEQVLPWYRYRPIFVNERRIQEGVDFWVAHRRELRRASERTGVAPQYLVAILGVETYYGRLTGGYRVIDALATLSFDYPPRAAFFRGQLEQFLLLARDHAFDPLTVKGSYAGAMGAPQFMPSAYRRFGVDATVDGRVDLWSDWPDVFDSIGYYLRENGWVDAGPVLRDAVLGAAATATAPTALLGPPTTVGALQAAGIRIVDAPGPDSRAWLVPAQQPQGLQWRIGFENFHAITRYNRSPLYAMAVHDLAVALRQRVPATPLALGRTR